MLVAESLALTEMFPCIFLYNTLLYASTQSLTLIFSKQFLVPTIAGDFIACIGVSEPSAGSDVSGIKTTARKVVIKESTCLCSIALRIDWEG